jgi:hypothetical protein
VNRDSGTASVNGGSGYLLGMAFFDNSVVSRELHPAIDGGTVAAILNGDYWLVVFRDFVVKLPRIVVRVRGRTVVCPFNMDDIGKGVWLKFGSDINDVFQVWVMFVVLVVNNLPVQLEDKTIVAFEDSD